MRHIDVSKPIVRKEGYELATWMVTITGNSFGDQIMTLKKYYSKYGYRDVLIDSNYEGEHQSDKDIIDRFKTWIKNQ